ncbi:type VII secretion integral membrane protein EccD [Cellulomonas shaoxiangyii]|uniref:Type VII secretion integral membrane protein EccD n=1 Tax=Cellulomonas shaoxiangyii TaxID=2566013 RepID=A0A4P7SNP2_9CELL|nr:type VII secretion integral membrane protein EccD [Cellulomonas shaoxiangyii]QCB94243.1 type VII secretion integral membrane protein EccD [Cellulomonas shaoxiangyii]TGY78296.1 type VII secretion integral membrane protein EccD [Cellulomonas shaoxiangyii]
MPQTTTAARALLHLTITSEDRRLDLGVPAQLPLVELMPGVVRSLGVLDPTLVHAGYGLRRSDGGLLDPAQSCAAQGVQDGELLTLVRGALVAEHRRYDDVVEAVVDATRDRAAWTAADQARTALAVSLVLLALGAGLLLSSPHGLGTGAIVALGAAVVLVTTGAVLTRTGAAEAGHGLGLAAAVWAAVGAYLLVPQGDLWGWPLAAAGMAAMVVGGLALATVASAPQVHVVPVAAGGAVGLTGMAAALLAPGDVAPWAVLVAVAATLSNLAPWLALSSTRLDVVSPHSDAEVLAAPPAVDGTDVARRALEGQRLLLSARVAAAVCVAVATPLVASSGATGAALCALAFVGLLFQSRQVHARSGVLTLMACGAVGITLTGTVVAVSGSVPPAVLTIVLLGSVAALVALTMLRPRARMRMVRLADTAELAVLTLLLPLGALTAGLV